MARSNGLGEFARRMSVVADIVSENIDKGVRKAYLVADQVAVSETPVDTARAKANWLPSIGAPAPGTIDPPVPGDAGASEAMALLAAQNVVVKWKAGKGVSLFLSNNLPYIIPLDDGHSPQSSDMSGKAVAAAREVLRSHKLLKGV